MTSGKTSAIARRGYLNIRTSKYILTGLSAVLLSQLYFNFLLTPELSRQTQLLAQIEQIKSGLHKVKAVNIKAKQIYDKESLQARENDLAKLLPTEWKRAELLRWLTNAIQKN